MTVEAYSATAGDQTDTITDDARRLRRRLGRADLRAVPEARRALRELLRQWGRPGRSEIAELLTSELVTNAIVHTDHDAVLTAVLEPDGLRVEVRDFVARRPERHTPDTDDDTHGRGLVLVESLADAWGYGRTGWASRCGSNWAPRRREPVTGRGGAGPERSDPGPRARPGG